MIIVSAADITDIKSLIQFINSFNKYMNDECILIIYDLGIDTEDWKKLKKTYNKKNFIFKT